MNARTSIAMSVLFLLAARLCLADDIEQYCLDGIKVQGAGREYIQAVDGSGDKLQFLSGNGRFFDSQGRRIQPDDVLRRDDVLFVVYRAGDAERKILTGVLQQRASEAGQASLTAGAPRGQEFRFANGATLTLARGWHQEKGDGSDAISFRTTGRLSMVFVDVREASHSTTAEVLEMLENTAPTSWRVLGSQIIRVNDFVFAHQQAVTLLQWDRGFEWVNRSTGERTPAASPLHELDLVDRFAYRTPEGKLVQATSLIPVQEYATRIQDVHAMVATLRVRP